MEILNREEAGKLLKKYKIFPKPNENGWKNIPGINHGGKNISGIAKRGLYR